MAATNPFRVSDLVHKYGWDIIPYLSNLGITLLTDSAILFVDSNATNALDADDTEHGHSLQKPLATIDYAVGLTTANSDDIILVAPGHAEPVNSATALAIDVAGVRVIGLGEGARRPTITVGLASTAGCTINMSGANTTLKNFNIIITAVDVDSIILVNATGVTLEDLNIIQTITSYEAANAIEDSAANSCDDLTIRNVRIWGSTATGAEAGIFLDEVQDNVRIIGCTIVGDYDNAAIHSNAILTDVLVQDCDLTNDQTGDHALEFSAAALGNLVRNHYHGDTDAALVDPGSCFSYECFGCDTVDTSGFRLPAIGSAT